jgi:short-subunit dehydrogenase
MRNCLKTILITGASSGIGAALAVAYAGAGITLILTARNEQRLNAVADACRAKGALVFTECVDVREKEKLAAIIYSMDAQHPIDLVIANAGVSSNDAEEVFAVNLHGVLNTIHPLIPRMVARGRGQIAIMSSLAGIRALPSAPAYSASKAAVRFYGDALRGELKSTGVNVSVICPGWIVTPLTDKNDFPMPLIMSAERAASIIIHSLALKKPRIAFPRRLYFPLRILDALPVFVSDVLFARLPKKRQKI